MKLKDSYTYFYVRNYKINDVLLLLKRENINVYEVTKKEYIKIKYSDFIFFKQNYFYLDTIQISYTGFKYILFFLRKYYLALIELFVSIIFVFICSFLIVDIEIDTTDESFKVLIKDELEKNHIAKFTFKKKYDDIQLIKEKIKNNNLDKIEWLEIENVGMKYIVHVEKRIINVAEEKDKYCHVYAKKEGLVSKIKMFRGQTSLIINDYVKEGDLLISGDITKDDKIVNRVCADGKVYAQVWYTVNIKVPLSYEEKEKTGKKRYNFIVNYDGVEHQIFKDRLNDYVSDKKEIFNVLGVNLYLKTDYEVKNNIKDYTESEALEKAINDAKKSIKDKLKDGETIIDEKVLQKNVIDSTMDVEIFIITEEEIGIIKKVEEVEDDIQFNQK